MVFFRSGRSCETQLISTTHDLWSSFNTKSQIDVAILDFSKAFDTVPHAGLLGKLEHYGIDSKMLLWIINFRNNRKQRVVVDGSFSNIFFLLDEQKYTSIYIQIVKKIKHIITHSHNLSNTYK